MANGSFINAAIFFGLMHYEQHSKSFACQYVQTKKLFKIYAPIKCIFLLNLCGLKANVTSL